MLQVTLVVIAISLLCCMVGASDVFELVTDMDRTYKTYGIIFDVVAKDKDIEILQLGVQLANRKPHNLKVYTKPGTYRGNLNKEKKWTNVQSLTDFQSTRRARGTSTMFPTLENDDGSLKPLAVVKAGQTVGVAIYGESVCIATTRSDIWKGGLYKQDSRISLTIGAAGLKTFKGALSGTYTFSGTVVYRVLED